MNIYFFNVNLSVSINDYSFTYICIVCYLQLRFYCLTFSVNDFKILILIIEMVFVFQNKTIIKVFGF